MDKEIVLPKIMAYHLLEEITNGFSEDRELGRGTYGKVYLGLRTDGEKIAVKMLHPLLGLNDEQFEKEYQNLEHLQHQNIVQLVGYCNETRRAFVSFERRRVLCEVTHRALCFEYMQNGSLDNCLSDESSGHDWHTRYAIIIGICKGVQYLHEQLKPPIFHLDLKPANVLLDANMVAKIADFGLSRLMGAEHTHITASPIGTIGYLPPEYINQHVISSKLDIFSLGVIILKIMAGPTGYSQSAEMSSQEFIDLVHKKWRNRLEVESIDTVESYCDQIKRCLTIALTCVEVDRHKRPNIGEIVNELNVADTIIQSPDQESWRTAVEENEREVLNNTENLFGAVVDNYKLEKMARYTGRPKTRIDRAREAFILVNEDDKDGKASNYFDDLRPFFSAGVLCLFYNATGDTIYQVAHHDWCGEIATSYPTKIGNGQWGVFRHAASPSHYSTAAVVYRGKNKDGEDHDYLLAWRAMSLIFRGNQCHCEIGGVDHFQKHWPSLEKILVGSNSSSNAKSDGCEIGAKIARGYNPKFTAIISYI